MKQYLDLLRDVNTNGVTRDDRTGTGTKSVFGRQLQFDLKQGFPLLTTKKVFTKGIIHELLWMIKGDTNIQYLLDNNVHIWDEWATESGDLGPVYGKQWRDWIGKNGIHYDQLKSVIQEIKTNPFSRRLLVSAWNVDDLPDASISPQENVLNGKQALPPCHTLFQFYVSEMDMYDYYLYLKYILDNPNSTLDKHEINNELIDCFNDNKIVFSPAVYRYESNERKKVDLDEFCYGKAASDIMDKYNINCPKYKLSCQLYQRSADIFLGVPFNIASYSLLTHMIAHECEMWVDTFTHSFGDVHIYKNHQEQVDLQLSREPLPNTAKVYIDVEPKTSIFDMKYDDIKIVRYESHPAIKADVSV